MTDLANLVLAVDTTQVKAGVAQLDGLTAAGARAEAATGRLGGGMKGAAAQASVMAASAQASARAAVAMGAGMDVATSKLHVNTIAMRESIVVARELSRGNFSRIPGSLSLLAQNVSGGFGGFASQVAQMLGLIKTVQNAELAATAASAEASAASIRSVAQRAGANILAADTELALAQAQLRTAETAEAAAAAEARIAAANEAVAAAASEAAIAENALAVAQGRATEASAANAAATRTLIGGTGVGLIGIGVVAGVAYGAIKQFQDQVKDSGQLDTFAESLRLTDEQIKKLGGSVSYAADGTREISGLTVSMGDVMASVWEEVTRNSKGAWGNMQTAAHDGTSNILSFWNQTSAAISAGLWTLADIAKDVFQFIAQKIGQSFYSGVNSAIGAINALNAKIPAWLGGGNAHLISPLKADPRVATLGGLGATIRSQADKNFADALAANNAAFGRVENGALQRRRNAMQELSDANKPPKGRNPRQEGDHGLDDALAKLDAEIKGQRALAEAYLQSDAAAQRAIALQKAEEDAIKHKADAGLFYEKELQKLVLTDAAEAGKRIASMRDETAARAKVNAMVAAGVIPASQAGNALKQETALQKLQTDLENAHTIPDKVLILKLIRETIAAQAGLNAEIAKANALNQIAANSNEIAKLQLQKDLIGASAREAAIANAKLDANQYIKDNNITDPVQQATLRAQALQKAVLSVKTPFEEWASTIPHTAQAISDAFQQIEFKGLDGLASAITDVITGTKSLGAAFKDIASSIIHDIIQMTIRMLIFRAISAAFGGGGFAPPLGSANGNVFSGGNVIPFANGGIVTGPTLFPMANGTGLMGEAGPEAVMPLARDGQGRLGVRSSNDNQGGPIEVHVIVDASDDLMVKAAVVADSRIARAAPVIVQKASQATLKSITRPRLP